MNLSDELRKIAELRREGYLTEDEFAEAKRQILARGNAGPEIRDDGQNMEEAKEPDRMVEPVFYSSRLTAGNIFFPDAVILEEDGIIFEKRSFLGSREEHINYKTIASFRVTNGIFFSTITIETSGGSQPIVVSGLWKAEAKELQDILRDHQIQAQRHG